MKLSSVAYSWFVWASGLISPGPHDRDVLQQPISHGDVKNKDAHPPHSNAGGPVFPVPYVPPWEEQLYCDYSAMGHEWVPCNKEDDRGCWLRNTVTGERYDINTDYESKRPRGTTRHYWLDVDKMTLSGDGFSMKHGKVFNQTYPGPWLQACWGDKIEVTVTNHLKYNGTSIHWHGVRQLNNMEADGVNGITQCPIAGWPMNDSYTYKFNVEQYGTTWYHSHYSLQYGDGLLGPITFYGPSAANFTYAMPPLMMTDNLHTSAFEAFYKEIVPGLGPPPMDGILLNGTGIYDCTPHEIKKGVCVNQNTRFNLTVKEGNSYLMRLINTAVDTTFVFSIDNHEIEVISSDFVPIWPYKTNSILVGIGQRYHVVLHAKPINDTRPQEKQSYWMRTDPADGCYNFGEKNGIPWKPASNTGILYYESSDRSLPTTEPPEDAKDRFCMDEPYDKLKPILPWTVGYPSNQQENSTFEVSLVPPMAPGPYPPRGNFSRWTLGMQPMWLEFGDPTIRHINSGVTGWADNLVVIPTLGEEARVPPENQWIYLLITGDQFPFGTPKHRNFVPVAHPIHLHGHDFALIAQSPRPFWPGFANFKLDNPPRRDVALLPQGGFLVIAFKADNPGAWIVHCHIAWHASAGLAVQILERDGLIKWTNSAATNETCAKWKKWHKNRNNWYEGMKADSEFQDDSGI